MAMGNLGSMYGSGLLGQPDFAEARGWFERAAAENYGEAMYQLGLMDQDGDGIPAPDEAAARAWFTRAVGQNVAPAFFSLGELVEEGRGGLMDVAEAIALYRKGAALGDEDAEAALDRLRCPFGLKNEKGETAGRICFDPRS